MDNKRYLYALYKEEKIHSAIYRLLANKEKRKKLKNALDELAKIEKKHAALWSMLVDVNKVKISWLEIRWQGFLIYIINEIFGLSLTIKFLEYKETGYYKKLGKVFSLYKSKKEARIIAKIKRSENLKESPLKNSINEYGKVISNIRDITIGMNDGLVEVLAATAGLAAAINIPLLVLIGGLIVALSGTLSMAGAAYLSTEYEKGVRIVQKRSYSSPKKSALYIGVSYIIGSSFPLIPYLFGYGGFNGIILSIACTMLVLAITATIIAVITNVDIKKRMLKTILISLGATTATILLGYFARYFLHITI